MIDTCKISINLQKYKDTKISEMDTSLICQAENMLLPVWHNAVQPLIKNTQLYILVQPHLQLWGHYEASSYQSYFWLLFSYNYHVIMCASKGGDVQSGVGNYIMFDKNKVTPPYNGYVPMVSILEMFHHIRIMPPPSSLHNVCLEHRSTFIETILFRHVYWTHGVYRLLLQPHWHI